MEEISPGYGRDFRFDREWENINRIGEGGWMVDWLSLLRMARTIEGTLIGEDSP